MIGLWHCLKSFSTGKNAGEQTTIVAWSNCASHEPKIKTPQGRFNFWLGQLIPSDIYEYMSCGAFVSVQTAQCLFSLTHCRTKQQIVAWSNCASHEPKIKTPQGRFNFWLTIVNELRTVYYHDIIRLAPELEKVNEITKNLYFHKNCNRIAL